MRNLHDVLNYINHSLQHEPRIEIIHKCMSYSCKVQQNLRKEGHFLHLFRLNHTIDQLSNSFLKNCIIMKNYRRQCPSVLRCQFIASPALLCNMYVPIYSALLILLLKCNLMTLTILLITTV